MQPGRVLQATEPQIKLKGVIKMKNYKEYDKEYIGGSDIATLVLVGFNREVDNGLKIEPLHFGGDGSYNAYVVDADAEIGNHYKEVASFNSWLKIYDDEELTKRFEADNITVYRAAEMGCIIKLH
jgi:hypothetical protein